MFEALSGRKEGDLLVIFRVLILSDRMQAHVDKAL